MCTVVVGTLLSCVHQINVHLPPARGSAERPVYFTPFRRHWPRCFIPKAKGLFEAAIKANPSHAESLGNLAVLLHGRPFTSAAMLDKIEGLYKRAVHADPVNANNFSNFGLFLAEVSNQCVQECKYYHFFAARGLSNYTNLRRATDSCTLHHSSHLVSLHAGRYPILPPLCNPVGLGEKAETGRCCWSGGAVQEGRCHRPLPRQLHLQPRGLARQ